MSIKPANYLFICQQAELLLQTYHSVKEPQTIQAVEAIVVEKIENQFETTPTVVEEFLKELFSQPLTKQRLTNLLETLKESVEPFKVPSNQQLKKLFRKTKKLAIPKWHTMDLQLHSYVGWNDASMQKKFMILYQNESLIGVSGYLSPTTQKGICTICHRKSDVSLFLATTKANSDGTYTKKGNYICHDSETCNHQLVQIEKLSEFVALITADKQK